MAVFNLTQARLELLDLASQVIQFKIAVGDAFLVSLNFRKQGLIILKRVKRDATCFPEITYLLELLQALSEPCFAAFANSHTVTKTLTATELSA